VSSRSGAETAESSHDAAHAGPSGDSLPAGAPAANAGAAEADDPAIARWWTRNYLRRDLRPFEARVLRDLALMLDDLSPAQVDPALCAVAADATSSLIVVMPHRSLGGLTLVLTVTDRFVSLSWTALSDLARHDDLDLSREVYLYTGDGTEESVRHEAVLGLRDQLRRPIVLRVRTSSRQVPLSAACYLRGPDGRLRRLARLPPRVPWPQRLLRRRRTSEHEIHFTDRQPPPYTVPSRAGAWFRAYAKRRGA
jgi:hypothetical protein